MNPTHHLHSVALIAAAQLILLAATYVAPYLLGACL
jgi:hypothetical protein